MDFQQLINQILDIEVEALQKAREYLLEPVQTSCKLILKTKGKLIVTGVGKSGLIGTKMAATFASTGTSSFSMHPTEAMHGNLGMIGKNDLVLAISYSGESAELSQILPHIQRMGVKIIGMTNSKNSTLKRFSDVFIPLVVEKEACPFNAAPTTSTTLMLAIGDVLAICLMHKRGFTKSDFALFHPGGSLGRRLFVKVKDLMQTQNLPIVGRKESLKTALLKMSEGRLGTVLVAEEGRIFGLLSDGDLRRIMINKAFNLEQNAYELSTKNPSVLKDENFLAYEALKIIENKKIQLLPVLKNGHLIGILHLHSLVQAGIG